MPRIETRTGDQRDDFFGTEVHDPYRWLEDGDDPEVVEWLRMQAAHAREQLDPLPGRAAITAALRSAIDVPHSGLPVHRGTSWFRTLNDAGTQQDVLVVSDEPFGPHRVLIDPNPLTPDASTGIAAFVPSPDGALVAYAYIEAGSDWRVWRVRDVVSGVDHEELVRWSKFCWPVWLPDGTGFVYSRFDAPSGDEFVAGNSGERLLLHRLGTTQAADEHVFALPDEPDVTLWAEITSDDRWQIVLASRGTEHAARVWVRDLRGDPTLRPVITEATASWVPVGTLGDELLMRTDLDAPRSRIVALDPATAAVREVVAEQPDALEGAVLAGGRLVLHYLHDAASRLVVCELSGAAVHEVALPGLGSVTAIEARAGETLLHLGWTSFTAPPAVLGHDVATGEVHPAFAVELDDAGLVTEQVRVTSRDGTEVPLFLVHRRDVTIGNGPHPAWLYGYGGFRAATTPTFEPTRYAFAAAGGVVAVACLRGGGEFGAAWHDAGRRANKQNVFDDAIACAEHLIAAGWTSPDRLAASGRSNGGLLAGALLTQRPELFAAVVPEVGVLDLLRYPLWTIGWAWIPDYGDPRADEAQFRTLHAYSPLHNLRPDAHYPPVLVLTSDHDDRVVPAHSMKFAARLQAVAPDDAVALLRVEPAGGHKEGRSRHALVAERSDVLAFISAHTGLDWT